MWIIVLIVVILVASLFAFIHFKKKSLENNVIAFLTTEENISESDIISSEPFIANLAGNKNYMVSIRLKNKNKTYFYYQNENKEIILESYTENGVEHVQDN